jgi:hypothetical protein
LVFLANLQNVGTGFRTFHFVARVSETQPVFCVTYH